MRIVRCATPAGARYGIAASDHIRLLAGFPWEPHEVAGEIGLDDARLLAPCEPGKIVAVGFNYARHAEELRSAVPAEPLLFLKPATAVIGPEAPIVLPPMSRQVEYEGELALVIGRRAKNVSPAEAGEVVLGCTCFNDVTARDLQKKDGQFTRAKGFDTFAPMGPWIATGLAPDAALAIETRLNGTVRQRGDTSLMLWSPSALVSYVSRIMTLMPGDVIATGTPAGVGGLSPGDTVSITIEKIGTLTNKVESYGHD